MLFTRCGTLITTFGLALGASALILAGCAIDDGDDVGRGQDQLVPDHGDPDDGCGMECGGELDVDCGAGHYCATDTCGGRGTCRARPQACTEEWDPVCGCDGETYSNACHAAAAGTGVAHEGECQAAGGECGGPLDVVCPNGTYCVSEDGTCGGSGTCQPIGDPQCPEIADPVCGCDGKTYDNECFAAAAGVDIAYDGACQNRSVCGGFAGLTCADDEYCHHENGTCGEYDLQGKCAPRPEVCTDEWAPVCGCDGNTHGNACEAAASGTSIRHEGPCQSNEAAD